jgi:hypothetical protein
MGNLLGSDGIRVSGGRSGSWADRRLVQEQLLANLTNYFATHGFSHPDAAVHAQAQAFSLLERQATFLGFWIVLRPSDGSL